MSYPLRSFLKDNKPLLTAFAGAVLLALFFYSSKMAMLSPPSPPLDINPLDELLAGLPWGNIAYSVPPSVALDEKVDALLRLSPQKSMTELQATLDAVRPSHFANIKIASRMKAALTSDSAGLQIIANDDPVQAVSFSEDTVWSWRIIAREPGSYWLHMTVAILVKIDGEDTYRTINSHEESIFVKATASRRFKRFLVNYWQWIATTLAIPLLIFLYGRFQARRQKSIEEKQDRNRPPIGFGLPPSTEDKTPLGGESNSNKAKNPKA
jgi:hypothetical protein